MTTPSIPPSVLTSAGISAAGGVIKRTKRAFLAISAPTSSATTTVTNKLERFALQLPVTTTRWRIRVRNWVPFSATLGTADVVLSDLYIGPASISSTGAVVAAFASAPVNVLAGASLGTAGALYTSGWITDAGSQFQAGTTYLLSQAFTTSNGGTIASGSQYIEQAVINNGGFALVGTTGNPANVVATGTSHLDRVIEYEFTTETNTPVGIVIGDSISVGNSTTSIPVRGDQLWHQRVGMATGSPIATAGYSGYTTSNFTTSANGVYTRFDLGSGWVPDYAVVTVGNNDFAGVQNPATVEANIFTIVNILKAYGIPKVYLGTISQRMNSGVTGYFSRSTLTATANIGDTTITTQGPVVPDTSLGRFITLDPTVAAEELVQASTVSSGSPGSYSTTVAALTKAHAIGSVVQSTGETYRNQYNAWARAVPAGIYGVFDYDKALRDPSAIYQMDPLLTVDTLHPNTAGHQAMNQITPIPSTYPS
jgi:lysophospholipase L1-like esterase